MTVLDKQSIPLISIAIVTWNRSSEVLRAIQSIYDQNYSNFEIVVTDNQSTDGTVELIEQFFPDTKIIQLHRNLGVTGGRNIGLANCRGEIIFILDDDAVLQPDTLTLIMDFFATASLEIGLVACQIFENGVYKFPKQSGSTSVFEGCGWAIRRSAIKKIGYFCDHFFRNGEETDFSFNYLSAGYQMWYLSEAIIHHMPSQVRVKAAISFYKCRNELIIIFERYPLHLVLPFAIWTLISQVKYGIYHPTHLPFIIKGFLCGLLKAPEYLSKRRPVTFSIIKKVRFSPMHGSKLAKFFAE